MCVTIVTWSVTCILRSVSFQQLSTYLRVIFSCVCSDLVQLRSHSHQSWQQSWRGHAGKWTPSHDTLGIGSMMYLNWSFCWCFRSKYPPSIGFKMVFLESHWDIWETHFRKTNIGGWGRCLHIKIYINDAMCVCVCVPIYVNMHCIYVRTSKHSNKNTA